MAHTRRSVYAKSCLDFCNAYYCANIAYIVTALFRTHPMWGHITECTVMKNLAAIKGFRTYDDQKPIQIQTCKNLNVSGIQFMHVI